jgi:hypothetical protein
MSNVLRILLVCGRAYQPPTAWASAALGCAGSAGSLHRSGRGHGRWRRNGSEVMRAEIEKLVEEIKQSVGLLRRHL